MAKRYFVTTRLLEEGMIIDQSIKDGAGRVLLARGSQVTEEVLASLKRFGINGSDPAHKMWKLNRFAKTEK